MPAIPKSSTLDILPRPTRKPVQDRIGAGTFDDNSAELRLEAGRREAADHSRRASNLGMVGGALKGIAALGAHLEAQQEEEDKAAAKSAAAMLGKDVRGWMYTGDDPYMARSGIHAVKGYEEFQSKYDEAVEAAASKLSNDKQREYFRATMQPRTSSTMNALGRVALAGHKQYEDDSRVLNIDAFEKQSIQAALTGQAPDKFMAAAEAETKLRGEKLGWPTQKTEAEVVKMRSRVHAEVLQQMARDNPKAARAYFKALKSDGTAQADLDIRVRDKLDALIEQQEGHSEAVDAANAVMDAGGSQMQQLKALRQRYEAGELSAKSLEHAEARVNRMGELRRSQASKWKVAAGRNAVHAILVEGKDPDEYFKANPAIVSALSPSVYRDLLKGKPFVYNGHTDQVVKSLVNSVSTEAQRDVALKFVHDNARSLTPSLYASYVDDLVDFDPNKLKDPFKGVKKDELEAAIAGQIGVPPGKSDSQTRWAEYSQQLGEVRSAADTVIQAWHAANGQDKTPPPEVIDQAIDAVRSLGLKGAGFFGSDQTFKDISEDDKEFARSDLRRLGMPTDIASVQRRLQDETDKSDVIAAIRHMIKIDPQKRFQLDAGTVRSFWDLYLRDDKWRASIRKFIE